MSLDIERLKEDADPEEVAEAIELDIQYMNRRTSILCPAHNDHNHGSCFLTETGYECFSCNTREDIIDMVKRVKKVGFLEACKLIADLYGGVEQYETGGQTNYQAKVPTREECSLIGIVNQPVYVPIGETYSEEKSYNKGLYKTQLVLESLTEERPRYHIYQMVKSNPLRALRRLDEECYQELIVDHCKNTLLELDQFIGILRDPKKASNQQEKTARREALASVSLDKAILALQQLINEVRSIALRYTGGSLTEIGEQTEDTALLAMVTMVNASFMEGGDVPF